MKRTAWVCLIVVVGFSAGANRVRGKAIDADFGCHEARNLSAPSASWARMRGEVQDT